MWRRFESGASRDGGVAPRAAAGGLDEAARLWRGVAHALALSISFWAGLLYLLAR